MELGGEAQIAALAGSALTTEKQSSSDTGSSTSAGPLGHTIPVFFVECSRVRAITLVVLWRR